MSSSDSFALNCWSVAYLIGFVLVWLGVVMEGAEVFQRRKQEWQRRKSAVEPWDSPPESKVPHWVHVMGDWGWLILVIGLVLEEVSHSNMKRIENREQRRLTALATNATHDAGKANERAGLANERASSNALQVAELTRDNLLLHSAVVELAHQYDLSTNALAEARARIEQTRIELSPSNFPITSVSGICRIVITTNDAEAAVGLMGKSVLLGLISDDDFQNPLWRGPFLGAPVSGIVSSIVTNDSLIAIGMRFVDDTGIKRAGPFPPVTFNNLKYVRLSIWFAQGTPVKVIRGWVELELSSQFELRAHFNFPLQTNGPTGIFGTREEQFGIVSPLPR